MNFRALALGSVAALALSAGFASAADLPRRTAAVALADEALAGLTSRTADNPVGITLEAARQEG